MRKEETILIVEDEMIIAQDIQMLLEQIKYKNIEIISSGEQVLTYIENRTPDLILMDVFLKGYISGIETAKKLKEKHTTIPIIFLTAHSDENTFSEIKDLSSYGYLIKPIKSYELQIAVELALYKSKMESKIKEERDNLLALIENLPYSMLLIDKMRKPVYVNTEFTTLTGYKLDDIANVNVFTKIIHLNNEQEKTIKEWEKEKQKNHKTECKIICKDGKLKKIFFKINELKNNSIMILSDEN